MTIWQFAVTLVPEQALIQKLGTEEIPESISRDFFESTMWWKEYSIDFFSSVTTLLSRKSSWSEDIYQWGDESGDDFAVYMEEGTIESLRIRINAQQFNIELIEAIIRFCKENDLLIVDYEHFAVVPPDNLMLALEQSAANAFVENPRKFLESLGKNN